jgi:nucleoside 2-deoxyribosyltransferase
MTEEQHSSKILTSKIVYLSGPIENSSDGENWRTEPKKILTEKYELNVFDPFADIKQQWVPALNQARAEKNYEEIRKIAKQFVRKDLGNVNKADMVIAYLPFKVATTGTHHEIINANNMKKPVLLICPQGKENVPLWYFGFIHHNNMFGSFEEVYERLDEINLGKHVNDDRWSMIYDLI